LGSLPALRALDHFLGTLPAPRAPNHPCLYHRISSRPVCQIPSFKGRPGSQVHFLALVLPSLLRALQVTRRYSCKDTAAFKRLDTDLDLPTPGTSLVVVQSLEASLSGNSCSGPFHAEAQRHMLRDPSPMCMLQLPLLLWHLLKHHHRLDMDQAISLAASWQRNRHLLPNAASRRANQKRGWRCRRLPLVHQTAALNSPIPAPQKLKEKDSRSGGLALGTAVSQHLVPRRPHPRQLLPKRTPFNPAPRAHEPDRYEASSCPPA
jgi:hypothetical protein